MRQLTGIAGFERDPELDTLCSLCTVVGIGINLIISTFILPGITTGILASDVKFIQYLDSPGTNVISISGSIYTHGFGLEVEQISKP